MMHVQAIIPTAGSGVRFQSPKPKTLMPLGGKPVIIRTLEAFQKSTCVDSVVLVVKDEDRQDFDQVLKEYDIGCVAVCVSGGPTRCDSVFNGLQAVEADTDMVLVHDGARPLVSAALIDASVKSCLEHHAVVAAVPVKPTIKRVDQATGLIKETLVRDDLWEIQTPQVFRRDVLEAGYRHVSEKRPTDDAALVEASGHPVRIVEGEYTNIKITTPEDLIIAEAMLYSFDS